MVEVFSVLLKTSYENFQCIGYDDHKMTYMCVMKVVCSSMVVRNWNVFKTNSPKDSQVSLDNFELIRIIGVVL